MPGIVETDEKDPDALRDDADENCV